MGIALGGNLPQAVHRLVVVVWRGSIVVVEGNDAVGLCLYLGIFSLSGFKLYAIIGVVEFGNELTFAHCGTFVDENLLDASGYFE